MLAPATLQASAACDSRAPLHSVHGASVRYGSTAFCVRSDSVFRSRLMYERVNFETMPS
jgi:hypothetical protein